MAEKIHIFDDVAFFWWVTVMHAIWLIPFTIQKIWKYMRNTNKIRSSKNSHPTIKPIPTYLPKKKLNTSTDSNYSIGNILIALSWVLLLFLLVQLPRFQNKKVVSFDPCEILQIPHCHDVDSKMIEKKARKLSLLYHPDKCIYPPLSWPEYRCNEQFQLIQQAKEVLTDQDAMKKLKDNEWDRAAFYGLPTWILDNPEMYFAIYITFFVVLGVSVHFWWKRSNQYHKSGIKWKTINIFWRFIQPKMGLRHLLEILCASDEFRIMDIKIPDNHKDFVLLEQEIMRLRRNRNMPQDIMIMFKSMPYIRKSTVLLTAHLLGLDIPSSLYDQYLFVLSKVPKILNIMIDITILRERYWLQTKQLIQLKQALIQSTWPTESIFKQLPDWTPTVDRGMKKKGHKDILSLSNLPDAELKSALEHGYNNNHKLVDKAINMIRMYPFVNMRYCARTYGEKKIFNGDIVTVTVHLDRLYEPWKYKGNDIRIISKMKAPEFVEKHKNKETDNSSSDYAKFDADHDEFVSNARKLRLGSIDGPVVHSTGFPFRCYEKWLIVLIDKQTGIVVDYKAISDMSGLQKIDLHFRADKKESGRYPYILMAICDSYLGVDKQIQFKLHINRDQRKDEYKPKAVVNADYNDHGNEEAAGGVKWYYLWNETFWEFLVTLFLLYFIYLVLITSSFGKKYIDPCIQPFWEYIAGYLNHASDVIIGPINNVLVKEFGFDFNQWLNDTDNAEEDFDYNFDQE